jgi:hypothetical protein
MNRQSVDKMKKKNNKAKTARRPSIFMPKEISFMDRIHGLAQAAKQIALEEKAMASQPMTEKIQ